MKISSELWNDLIDANRDLELKGEKISIKYIEDKFDVSTWSATQLKFALDNKSIFHNDTSAPKERNKLDAKIRDLNARNKKLIDDAEHNDAVMDFYLNTAATKAGDVKAPQYKKDVASKKNGKNEATAFAILSDVHIEESVTYEGTDGLNEYNPEIAEQRLEKFFKNTLKLVEKERVHSNIDTMVLALLGDNITGYIHEELMESNHLSPTEATTLVRNLLISGIKYLVDNGNFKKIIIPCNYGNHGRTTKLKRFNTGHKNSYEWMMYQDMKKIFTEYLPEKYSKVVDIITSKNEYVYLDFYDEYTVRFCHGDHFRFAGGIGGLNVPLKKFLLRMNEQHKADMTFMGHWHQILLGVTEDCMINGSVMGINSYAMQFGGIPKPPQQIFTLLDKERGFTMRTPIDVL